MRGRSTALDVGGRVKTMRGSRMGSGLQGRELYGISKRKTRIPPMRWLVMWVLMKMLAVFSGLVALFAGIVLVVSCAMLLVNYPGFSWWTVLGTLFVATVTAPLCWLLLSAEPPLDVREVYTGESSTMSGSLWTSKNTVIG